jgi:FkbM family methyltransferase
LGIYSVPCAVLGARVVAVEPSTRALGALRANIELNGLGDMVRVFPVALAAHDGEGVLTTHLDVANRLESPGSSAGQETVVVRTLDSLMAEADSWLGERRVALIKIDCEGGDEDVLRAATGTIATHRPVVMVETWDGGRSIRRFLGELGYRVYRFDHTRVQLVEYPSGWSGQANFIAVPDDRFALVAKRLGEHPRPRPRLPALHWRLNGARTAR